MIQFEIPTRLFVHFEKQSGILGMKRGLKHLPMCVFERRFV